MIDDPITIGAMAARASGRDAGPAVGLFPAPFRWEVGHGDAD